MIRWLALALALSGCAHMAGYGGAHPGEIHCKGKGTVTGTGNAAASFGAGGSASNSFTLQADCGDGFDYMQQAPK